MNTIMRDELCLSAISHAMHLRFIDKGNDMAQAWLKDEKQFLFRFKPMIDGKVAGELHNT